MDDKKNKRIKLFLMIILSLTIFICAILLYSRYVATTGLIIKEYKVTSEKITENFHGLKIVHISDIHYGTTIGEKEIKNIVNKVNLLKPDIVVLTGDLLDEETNINTSQNIISKQLSNIKATIGKFAIKGNHDNKFEEWDKIIESSGFINLDESYDKIYKNENNYILISGVSTNINENNNINDKLQSTKDFLNTLPEEQKNTLYKILLLHEPDFVDNIQDIEFDLILAGHSHNGQIKLPFIGALKTPIYSKKYYKEHYIINTTDLYISSGLGTSKIKFRLFNRPSINFYRITKK